LNFFKLPSAFLADVFIGWHGSYLDSKLRRKLKNFKHAPAPRARMPPFLAGPARFVLLCYSGYVGKSIAGQSILRAGVSKKAEGWVAFSVVRDRRGWSHDPDPPEPQA